MIVRQKAHELVELDMLRTKALVKHHNSKYLQPYIDAFQFENFEGEFDIYEISYIKYMAVKHQRYLKAALLRDLEKKVIGIN